VKISGVRVGKILEIKVDPVTFMARVEFHLPNDMKLPKDTTASVSSDGLFGGKYLSLTPGGEDKTLKAGEIIENTTGPVNLESLIGKFVLSKDK
jgi:phospholipid/cholesterol/gamma-HCH transport system substrate-binding protein